MSKQLELDINRPSWADTDFHSEMKGVWSVRRDSSPNTENKDHFKPELQTEYANPTAQQSAKNL